MKTFIRGDLRNQVTPCCAGSVGRIAAPPSGLRRRCCSRRRGHLDDGLACGARGLGLASRPAGKPNEAEGADQPIA